MSFRATNIWGKRLVMEQDIVKYEDIEIVRNLGDEKTYFTVEIHTKLTNRQAERLAECIYEIDLSQVTLRGKG